ncbi:hypothetical protein IMY05_014G0014800 [Salix suchowensis]|nr:hypothetical protein IMY05_014G0014800 [Salix suchowensis]
MDRVARNLVNNGHECTRPRWWLFFFFFPCSVLKISRIIFKLSTTLYTSLIWFILVA